jgi:predicted RNase H-like nuclease (RuvC/YqgF family)
LQLAAISQSVKSLATQLRQFEARPGDFGINRAELARRRSLIEGLEKQLATLSGSSSGDASRTATTASNGRLAQQRETMREHDRIVEDLGKGVSRLHQTSTMINDEANLHVRLLNDMDVDVERASAGLRQEAQHAERVSLLAYPFTHNSMQQYVQCELLKFVHYYACSRTSPSCEHTSKL